MQELTIRKEIEWSEWLETKVESRVEIETGKQQVAAIHSNYIVGQEIKNQTQESRQTQDSGKSLALIKALEKALISWKALEKALSINLFLEKALISLKFVSKLL